jgi:hypothetical protein
LSLFNALALVLVSTDIKKRALARLCWFWLLFNKSTGLFTSLRLLGCFH